jgi:hypothetical protein
MVFPALAYAALGRAVSDRNERDDNTKPVRPDIDPITNRRPHRVFPQPVSVVGAERVLFGTDWPHQVFDIKGAFVHTGTFAPAARDAMRSANARRIFGI